MFTPTRSAFGQILGHPTKPNLRMFFPPDGDGTGGGSSSGGSSSSGDGGQGGTGGDGGQGQQGEQGVDAPTAKALREQADKRMRERNEARDALKPWTDLGITPDEAKQLKEQRDAANGGPSAEELADRAQKAADKAAAEKFAGVARRSAVRAQAAELGFHNPTAALAMLDTAKVAEISVDENYEADAAAVKNLLEALGKAEPYLLKTSGQQTADHRTAGIGAVGGSTKPDPGPGTPRMANAYATSSTGGRSR
jgi:hypothetical protein